MVERPIIHREMAVEVAEALVKELERLLALEEEYRPRVSGSASPQTEALTQDLCQTLAQLKDQA